MENTKEVSIKKILVTIAGPAVNMFIIILNKIYVLKTGNLELFSIGIEEIIYANLLLFIFNMQKARGVPMKQSSRRCGQHCR